jgi:hypothetical protein
MIGSAHARNFFAAWPLRSTQINARYPAVGARATDVKQRHHPEAPRQPVSSVSSVSYERPSRNPHPGSASLVDILDLVLDKGLVVAGDIKVSLADIELLTLRIRLVVCSIDKAEQIGLDWWKHDRHFSPGLAPVPQKIRRLAQPAARARASRTSQPPSLKGVTQ